MFKRLDREPIWRKLEDKVDSKASEVRNVPGSRLKRKFPQFENRNFGGGIAVGLVEAGVAMILKETVGVPFGSETEIVGVTPRNGGVVYTINVDAPANNMAEARAFLESGTGFTSILTDKLEVENSEILKTRVLRDTYQIEILVED